MPTSAWPFHVNAHNGRPPKLSPTRTRRRLVVTLNTVEDYCSLLEKNGCAIVEAEDTGRFAHYVDLYLQMVDMQLTCDAMRILGFDDEGVARAVGDFVFLQELAHAGKVAQGRFIARRKWIKACQKRIRRGEHAAQRRARSSRMLDARRGSCREPTDSAGRIRPRAVSRARSVPVRGPALGRLAAGRRFMYT